MIAYRVLKRQRAQEWYTCLLRRACRRNEKLRFGTRSIDASRTGRIRRIESSRLIRGGSSGVVRRVCRTIARNGAKRLLKGENSIDALIPVYITPAF